MCGVPLFEKFLQLLNYLMKSKVRLSYAYLFCYLNDYKVESRRLQGSIDIEVFIDYSGG